MADGEIDLRQRTVRRKRATARSLLSKLSTSINEGTSGTDYEYAASRLQDILNNLVILDDEIHETLQDEAYDADAAKCEEYVEVAKRAILKASRMNKDNFSPSVTSSNPDSGKTAAIETPPIMHTVKLPTIRLEPFSGDVEKWSRFWEQFKSSIDDNPSISTIDKHVFLRGYLEEEPKYLVEGLPVTAEAYEESKQILLSRYGDKNRIIQAHLDYLESLRPMLVFSPDLLNTTYIDCNRRIQALKALGEKVDDYGRMLAPKILRAFPEDIVRRWIIYAKRENISESHITQLMKFLNDEVEGALTTQKIRGDTSAVPNYTPTAASLHVQAQPRKATQKISTRPEEFCVFCEIRGHWAQDCKKVTKTSARINKLKQTNRCFLCLNRGHTVSNCSKKGKAQCITCKKSHHKSICDGKREETSTERTHVTSVVKSDVQASAYTYLQTARVLIVGPTGLSKLTRCVLDGGSQTSFIAGSLIDELKIEPIDIRELTVCTFESQSNNSNRRRLVRFDMQGVSTNSVVTVKAFECGHALSPQPAVPLDVKAWAQTRKLQLADTKTDLQEDLPIEILIGGDFYWKIVKDSPTIRLSATTVLIPSIFGWILSGSRSGICVNSIAVNFINLGDTSLVSDSDIRRFWDLETIGISEYSNRSLKTTDSKILDEFHASFRVENQRRVVSLPKKETVVLASNRCNAEMRLTNLERRLRNNNQLKDMYYDQMLDYIKKGHVEIAPEEESPGATFYLPHQAVKKEKYGKTKWRIVFDASSHEAGALSLNETLEMGPNLLPEIFAILLRFRLHPEAVIGDITQAFLQLVLDEKDRDLTRFLWYEVIEDGDGHYHTGNQVTAYRFTRLPFGLTCSPFCLSAVLREHANRYHARFPIAAPLIDDNMFMDDFAAGAESENEVIALYYELTALMKLLSFPLSKWASNSEQLEVIWKAEGQQFDTRTQVLGVDWDTDTDCFQIHLEDISRKILDGPTTKRKLLQTTAMIYDPLGLFSPVSIVGKLLFQETWCRGIGWDELVPTDLGSQWHAWTSSLSSLSQAHIPRWLATLRRNDTQTHVFCDASEKAYGAALYIRSTTEDGVLIRLACSKNRLAPVKKVTLPRLELLAALLGTRLLQYFCSATGYDITQATLWTDSSVTLGWIKSDPNRWKVFICNRVTEIQSHTSPAQWRHCPGQDNPADLLTRGLMGNHIMYQDAWWYGPAWLTKSIDCWPSPLLSTRQQLPEEREKPTNVLTTITPHSLDASKFSCYWKLLRITAWIFRFIRNVRRRETYIGELTAAELMDARMHWISVVQKEAFPRELQALEGNLPLPRDSKISRYNPFLEDGLLRLGGRLQCADLSREQQRPLILEGSHQFTRLLIQETHKRLCHFGVRAVLSELRSEFWILRARQAVRKVLHACLPCKILKKPQGAQTEAPLPSDRVKPTKPFAVTGIDFAGPLYIKVGRDMQKAYIVLFTCATTRAMHLELCSNMMTHTLLMALQRFTGRRGLPHTIYTDNAKSFHAANVELLELWKTLIASKTHHFLAQNGITWKFIAPRASWWGGWWERMVGTTKRCLRKILGQAKLTEEQLNTTLVTIEAAINSRPITQGEDSAILTPAHFLVGERLTTIPTGAEPIARRDLTKEFRLRQKLADDFWRRWSKEYLLQLRSFHEVQQPGRKPTQLRIGDVVLVHEDLRPRHMWKRAVIEELQVGRDGKIRTVFLRNSDGQKMSRPIQLVVPLEVDQGGEDVGK